MVMRSNEQPNSTTTSTGSHARDALYLLQQRAYPVAAKEFSRALAEDPNDAEVWYFRGYTFSGMKAFDLALADFDQCLGLAPSYGLAHLGKSKIFCLRADHGAAVESFEKAQEYLGESNLEFCLEFCIQMGRSYAKLQKLSEAISLFNRVIATQPQNASLLSEKAEWQNELGLHVDAVKTCDEALAINPFSSSAIWKAIAQAHLRQYAAARETLGQLLQSSSSVLHEMRADIGSFAKTLDLLIQVEKHAPRYRASSRFQIPNMTSGRAIPGSEFSVGDPVLWSWIVITLLGDPGTSKTHYVYNTRTDSPAAMKRFPMQATGRSFDFESWEPELQLWWALGRHPNLLVPFRVDQHNDNVCLYSQYLGPHSSLTDKLKGGTIEYAQALRWGVQFCDAMIYAANHGVPCHYNLKPSNILIDNSGNLRLTDFDFRQCGKPHTTCEPREGLQPTVDLLPYVPHERFGGSPVDVRSDIYSFGVFLALMVTGRHPLGEGNRICLDDAEQAAKTWHDLHRSSPSLVVEGPISKIIAKCLATDMADRYQDFSRVRNDLVLEIGLTTGNNYLSASLLSEGSEQLYHRGMTYRNLDQGEYAVGWFRKALEYSPFNDVALNGLGAALEMIKDERQAMYCYRKAVKLHGRSAPLAWNNMGTTKQHEERHREALIYFQKALDLDPRCSAIWRFKGKSHRALGQLQDALRCFSTAVEVDPRNLEALEDRNAVLCSFKNTSDK